MRENILVNFDFVLYALNYVPARALLLNGREHVKLRGKDIACQRVEDLHEKQTEQALYGQIHKTSTLVQYVYRSNADTCVDRRRDPE